MEYEAFLEELDKRLAAYFNEYKEYICCEVGCSYCCEKGDYPLSDIELQYLMKGYILLDNAVKQAVRNNIKNMKKGGVCPFLLNNKCSVYAFRPIICRVHGLAYLCNKNTVKVPYCVNYGKNYAKVYANGEIEINPIKENLDTGFVLSKFNYNEIRNLCDWLR